jgi:hypothetical protein
MARPQVDPLWAVVHAERAALSEDVSDLNAGQSRHSGDGKHEPAPVGRSERDVCIGVGIENH